MSNDTQTILNLNREWRKYINKCVEWEHAYDFSPSPLTPITFAEYKHLWEIMNGKIH